MTASEVKPEPVEWLWPGRVPLSAITIVAGDPGLGKSLLSIEFAARLTRGELGGEAANALLLTAEDSIAHVAVPRLQAAGADLDRIKFGAIMRDGFETSILLPGDDQALRRLALEGRARLVVVDPLAAHLSGSINSWKDQEVRRALAPLHRLAEEAGAAVVVVAHLNKGESTDPLQRLGGSIGLPAAARSVLLLARDPDDPDGEDGGRRVLAQAKSNYGPPSSSLVFEIETVTLASSGITTASISEVGASAYGASELLVTEQPKRGAKTAKAVELLETELRVGPGRSGTCSNVLISSAFPSQPSNGPRRRSESSRARSRSERAGSGDSRTGRPLARRAARKWARLPREARNGVMRAWLEILKERHPDVTWVRRDETALEEAVNASSVEPAEPLAA